MFKSPSKGRPWQIVNIFVSYTKIIPQSIPAGDRNAIVNYIPKTLLLIQKKNTMNIK